MREMKNGICKRMGGLLAALGVLMFAGAGFAADPADNCRASKLKETGKYALCRMKAEARAVKTGQTADYAKCNSKIVDKFTKAEAKAGPGICPTEGDASDIQAQTSEDMTFLTEKSSGQRFIDNGDGTVTDAQTGLMWEQKTDDGSIHDKDDTYDWATSGVPPNGDAFQVFLSELNFAESADGTTSTGCFAGYCDWRLPTVEELQTILVEPHPCSTSPCIDPIFGPTQAVDYWSRTSLAGGIPELLNAWVVGFGDGSVGTIAKSGFACVRAVRTGS